MLTLFEIMSSPMLSDYEVSRGGGSTKQPVEFGLGKTAGLGWARGQSCGTAVRPTSRTPCPEAWGPGFIPRWVIVLASRAGGS